jgi:ABC-type Fe3+/spermidine/putrescine transport system ATPase subunit
MDEVLVAEDVRKSYGDVSALRGVSLSVGPGEVFGLIGPNGAGKTTLVRALTGTTTVEGRVRVLDSAPDAVDANRLGLLPQSFSPSARLSPRELLAYYAGLYERARDPDVVLEEVGLAEAADSWYEQLSGGQQRRTCVGAALVNDPDVLVLDEPLSGLDRALRERLRGEIARIQRDTGVTTLYVTHDQEAAMVLADRLVILAEGQIAGVGQPGALYESPPTAFVATFLGRANGLPVATEGPGLEPGEPAADGGKTGEATVEDRGGQCLVRPEDVSLGDPSEDPPTDGSDVCLAGLVTRVADLGSRYEVTVGLDAGGELTAEGRADPPPEGSRVTVGVDDEDVMRFEDQET